MSRTLNDLETGSTSESVTRPSSAMVIEHSPIEFVLSGPREKGDRVLVRSSGAKLDLVDVRSDDKANQQRRYTWLSPLALIGLSYRAEVAVVRSGALPLTELAADERSGWLSFTWRGLVSHEDVKVLQGEFDRRASDIQRAISRSL